MVEVRYVPGMLSGMVATLFLSGCMFHHHATPPPQADLRAEVHQMVKEELVSVREDYVKARPDLTDEERRAVLNGERQMSSVEEDRKRREQAGNAASTETSMDPELQEARSNYFELNPSVSPEVKKAIQESKVLLGMSSDEVRLSWREPKQVIKSVGDTGMLEFWDYGNNHFLTFSDGVLKSWNKAIGH